MVIDTDRATLQALGNRVILTGANAAVLDAAHRAPERFHAEWMNRDVLRERRFVEQGTGGSRMLGRFLLLLPDNLATLRGRLESWLNAPTGGQSRRRVYVVGSAGGGTASGQAADVAYLLQDLAARSEAEVDLRAILFVPPAGDPRLAPNAYAALTELHYFSDPHTCYRAHLGAGEEPFVTRRAPFHRVALVTSVTPDGDVIPLTELQERTVMYLMTATTGDDGSWDTVRAEQESHIPFVDVDGNPQVFTTFGAEWVEYPEERLVSAVYRNLVRRSISSWLLGDEPAGLSELPANVPLKDPDALARLLTGVGSEGTSIEPFMERIRIRLPIIHKAPQHQWQVMDQELQALIDEAAGSQPGPGRPAKGPMADRFKTIRAQVVSDLRGQGAVWLKKENLPLERVARVLSEAATELKTATDPVSQWEEARNAVAAQKAKILWMVGAIRKDPFLTFRKGMALKKLAKEYEKVAGLYVHHYLRAHSLPFLRELRSQVMEPVRSWSARIGELAGLYARMSRAMADYESHLLERLRKDDEEKRLVLGRLALPGAETPYIASSTWNLPFCTAADEAGAIKDLRQGWIERLVEREDGLLAEAGRSLLDGPEDRVGEDRTPWMAPSATTVVGSESPVSARMKNAIAQIDRELQARMEDRLRGWLSATAFQRMAEQYRDPISLETQIERLVGGAGSLPAIEPAHVRPAGFPMEYELIFFAEAKAGEVPSVLKMVVDAANRQRPTRVLPSRSPHFLTAVTEHGGFALSRCPVYHHLEEGYREARKPAGRQAGNAPQPESPFSRIDVPWDSATLVTRGRLRDASDVFYLALGLGVLRGGTAGEVPVPTSILPLEANERRFPLPGEFDLAVRQLAGDLRILDAVSQAVDRAVQSRGVDWCALQLERTVHGQEQIGTHFPGSSPTQQDRTHRLIALRAVARYDDLVEEYARTQAARETEWLKVGTSHFCPACGQDLGADADALPGTCPRCREVLLPFKAHGVKQSDGFRRIPNPFVVGTPLETRSSVFRGREDIINTVRDRLIRPASRTILILIGERRCGKTSALRQLQYRLEGDLTPIFVDMQGLTASDLPGFLWWLSWRMKETLDERGIHVDLPTFEQFTSGPPDYQFETQVLAEIRRKLGGGRILLMMDEFEVLAQRVMNGTFDGRAFDYLRHLMQHGEGIEFLFAGTHVLRSFAANYVTFLFNIGVFLSVDFLKPDDAVRLIQEPVAHASVTFTKEAVDSILELAGAHAYFTQMFGFHLVERLNRLRKRNVTKEDVEDEAGPVVNAASAHLDHLWGQLNSAERLLVAYFVDFCARGKKGREEDLLNAAIKDDSSLRPFVFRSAVEKLIAVGLLRAHEEETDDGRKVRALSLTAEVYRFWLKDTRPYSRQREEGVKWE